MLKALKSPEVLATAAIVIVGFFVVQAVRDHMPTGKFDFFNKGAAKEK